MKEERIQKLLSNYGEYSRRESERLISEGKVIINGNKAILGQKATIDDEIIVNKQKVKFKLKHLYFVVNKPKGFISSRIDEHEKRVIDLVPNPNNRNLFTIGRLDVNTTGLIIVTSDGELANSVNSPKNHIAKSYLVWLEKPISKFDIKQLSEGILLEDNIKTKPVKKLKIINNKGENILIKLTITEGKKNQIRRMFEVLNNNVINLKRIQVGNLLLNNTIESGSFKVMKKEDIYLNLGIKIK